MKKFTLIAGCLITSIAGYSQVCPAYVDAIFIPDFSNPNATRLLIAADANSLSNFKYFISCDGVQTDQGCVRIQGIAGSPGLAITPILTPCAGNYTYKLVFSEGDCGSGNPECDTISAPQGGPLPVVLGEYRIQRRSAGVELRWNTEQEINSSRFEIQRSIGIKGFETIGTINAKGNSSVVSNYSFSDNFNKSKEISFYRIKMIDVDGTYAYTGIKSVKGTNAALEFRVFPNPTSSAATVEISDLYEPVTISVMDHSGRIVKTLSLTNTNKISLNNLQKGNYIIRMTGKESGETTVRQLSVLK